MILTVEELFHLLAVLMGIVITVFLVPWLHCMLVDHRRRELLESAETAIAAVHRMFPHLDDDLRREYALNILESQGFNVNTLETKIAVEAATLRIQSILRDAGSAE